MANVIVSSVIGDMVSRAISFLTNQFRNQRSTEVKLRMIHHMVMKIQSVVEEAEGRQITNQGLLNWLSELIDGTYQGRYMLDIFRYGHGEAGDNREDDGDDKDSQTFSLSSFNPAKRLRVAVDITKTMLFQNDGMNELDSVLANLHIISENLKEFIMLLGSHPPMVHRPITTSLYVDCQMFGRHVERERIMNFLLQDEGPLTPQLSILPIIGHTGVGKNTLVQHVYGDARVRNHFSLVVLFDFYFLHRTLQGITWNCDELPLVHEKLGGKRFLIIFQNVDLQHKQQIKVLLPSLRCGKHGSKIIVTSNNKHVASIGTVEPIILGVLPQAEYWFFFKAHAFGSTDLEEDQRLVAIGKIIATRLKGSFIRAKIIGGILRANPSPQFWYKVLKNDAWKHGGYGDGVAYIIDMTSHFLLPLVKTYRLVESTTIGYSERTHLNLQNLFLGDHVAAHRSRNESEDRNNSCVLDVLLYKSIFPLYNMYYIARARCTMH